MGKQARIRRERRDGTGLAAAYKKAMRSIVHRVELVSAGMRTATFIESLKTRADLLVGTPREITSEAQVVALARTLLAEQGIGTDGVLITCKLSFGRLQFWARVSPQASLTAANEAREAVSKRSAGTAQAVA